MKRSKKRRCMQVQRKFNVEMFVYKHINPEHGCVSRKKKDPFYDLREMT